MLNRDAIVWPMKATSKLALCVVLLAPLASAAQTRGDLQCKPSGKDLIYAGVVQPEHADHLRLSSYCGTGSNRALADAGVLQLLPAPYSQLGALIRSGRIRCDVAMVQVSPPNARGEFSLGLAVEYLAPALEGSRAIIAEVNDHIPWTHTQPLLRHDDFDLVVESSRPPVYLQYGPPSDIEQRIAHHAAALVPDGATVECG